MNQQLLPILSLLLFQTGMAAAQLATYNQPHSPVIVVNSRQHQIYSATVKQVFDIYVALPNSYFTRDTTYPVLYMTDANVHFGMMTDIAQNLQGAKEMPEIILVGITYPLSQKASWGKIRVRDLTPTSSTQMDKWLGVDSIRSGGSPAFLQFIKEDLLPFVEKQYRIRSDDRAFAGFSVGGLFGLYMAFHQPGLFQRYIIGSPSIWYDNKFIVEQEKIFSASHKDWNATVFMSVGSREQIMVSDMVDLSSIIKARKYGKLQFHSIVLDGETHASSVSGCFQQGLRFLYPTSH